jgi:hypothetical protein
MKIGEIYELKDGKYGAPESYLGAGIEKFTLPDGTEAWSMKSDKYCKAAVETVKTMLAEEGKELKSGKRSHNRGRYHLATSLSWISQKNSMRKWCSATSN